MKHKKNIVLEPIDKLPLSDNALRFLWNNQIVTLQTLLAKNIGDWQRLPGYSYHIQYELLVFLEENGLGDEVIE